MVNLQKLLSLKSLTTRLQDMTTYLDKVCKGELPPNHQLINQIQAIFNLLPNLETEEMAKAFAVNANDNLLVLYLSSLIRSVIALHNLINNKLNNRELERKGTEEAKPEEKTDADEESAKEEKKEDKMEV